MRVLAKFPPHASAWPIPSRRLHDSEMYGNRSCIPSTKYWWTSQSTTATSRRVVGDGAAAVSSPLIGAVSIPRTMPADPVPYLPLNRRPRIAWPNGARVALWIAPNVEVYELMPPHNPLFTTWSRVPVPPDVLGFLYRDYGNRVGFWRVLDVLERYGIRATASLNVAVLDHFPEIGRAMAERDWAFMGHGVYNTQFLYGIEREDERALYREMQEKVRHATGREMRGMFGPHASLSPHSM